MARKKTCTIEVSESAHEYIKSKRGTGKMADVVDRLIMIAEQKQEINNE